MNPTQAGGLPAGASKQRQVAARTAAMRALALVLVFLLGGCMPPPRQQAGGLEVVLVRHAEKHTDDPADPALSDAGQVRAQRLADALRNEPLVAVYSTDYRRTRQTATPTASQHGLPVITYDARQPADTFAAALKQSHPRGTVLVVGHSNTVPAIAAALCGCEVAPMNEREYDRRMRVRVVADGRATLTVTRMP